MRTLRLVTKQTHIARQALRLKRGEINRRRFIMAAVATGVTLPTATSLAHKAEASQPKSGGVLRLGVADPNRLADIRRMTLGNTLLEVVPDGTLTGDLASSFEPDQNASRWKLTLKRDAAFHDGTPLSAAHVIASLSQTETPGTRGQIKSLHVDSDAVIINLIRPNPDFAWVLSDPKLTIHNDDGQGTGPYAQSRTSRHLRKVLNHWQAGRGNFDAIDLMSLKDPARRLKALLNGDVDLIDDVDPRMFALIERAPDFTLIETKDASLYGIARQAHTNSDVGRAINDVTDRRDLANKVLLGHGRAAPIPGCPECRNRTQLTPGQITLANEPAAFPGATELLELIARMANAKGVPAKVVPTPDADFKAKRVRVRPTVDWTLAEALARRPDLRLQQFVNNARSATSDDQRSHHHMEALQHLHDQGDVFPLLANDIHAHASALMVAKGPFDILRIAERGWFA